MKRNFKRHADQKIYSASKYLENLNKDQRYRSVKIKKSHRVVESRPMCLGPLKYENILETEGVYWIIYGNYF
jgi:replicative DNA helicase